MIISCSSDFCNTFDFTNHIKANTCFKSLNETSIDVVLENWPGSFQTFGVTTTGLIDCRKMILNFFGSYFSRLPPKTITCRSFRYFVRFLYELENKLCTKECNGVVKYLNKDLLTNFRQPYSTKTKPSEGKSSYFYHKRTKQRTRSRIKNKFNNGHPERPS